MVDNVNPTNQFHPYQPPDVKPNSDTTAMQGGLGGFLSKLGFDSSKVGGALKNTDVRGAAGKAREYARTNPGLVLGGLAAAVIGAGLLRKKAHHRAAGF